MKSNRAQTPCGFGSASEPDGYCDRSHANK